ncbi:MAG: NAD(P) transhydrogenase subunit alpha [Nakamurella sp.]
MSAELLFDLTTFVLALLVGFEVISKVPATLHTPLMSASNAIHGVVFIGALMITATARGPFGYIVAFFAMALAGMNVVGGYAVTDRMLDMFKAKPAPRTARSADGTGGSDVGGVAGEGVDNTGGPA